MTKNSLLQLKDKSGDLLQLSSVIGELIMMLCFLTYCNYSSFCWCRSSALSSFIACIREGSVRNYSTIFCFFPEAWYSPASFCRKAASEFIVFSFSSFSSPLHRWENKTIRHKAAQSQDYKAFLSWNISHCPTLTQVRRSMLKIIVTKRFAHASAVGAISSGSRWEVATTAVLSVVADGSLRPEDSLQDLLQDVTVVHLHLPLDWKSTEGGNVECFHHKEWINLTCCHAVTSVFHWQIKMKKCLLDFNIKLNLLSWLFRL